MHLRIKMFDDLKVEGDQEEGEFGKFGEEDLMTIYCINLKRRPDRRISAAREICRVFPEKDIVWIDATDGRLCNPLLVGNVKPPEFGCAESHLRISRDMMERNAKLALVLEDDVVFCRNFRRLLRLLLRRLPALWDHVNLGACPFVNSLPFGRDINQNEELSILRGGGGNTHAYLLRWTGAEVLSKLNARKLSYAIDFEIMSRDGELKLFQTHPNLVFQSFESSSGLMHALLNGPLDGNIGFERTLPIQQLILRFAETLIRSMKDEKSYAHLVRWLTT